MKNIIQHFLPVVLLLVAMTAARAQVSPNCVTASDDDYLTGKVFFNYGSVSNAVNSQRSTRFSLGQIAVGDHFGMTHRGAFGFWARFLKVPEPPSVLASEGDLEDRVQVDWYPDPLSPQANSFKLYRDGALLATLDGNTFTYVDFNVIAGRFYDYEVSGVNEFGEGNRGSTLGFLNPNGVVTGRVTTVSGNPVPEAMVTLSPTLGAALSFGGDDMAFSEYNDVFPRAQFTVSAWVKLGDGNDESAIFDFGSTIGKNWWLHTLPAAGGKGVRFGIGRSLGDVTVLSDTFPAATEDDWHHVAASYNGSSLLLYVDGELISTAVAGIEMDSIPLFFGKRAGGTHYYNGALDELRFFDRQLSQTEIQMFMNRSVSAASEGLVGYWKFDEGTGSKAFDQSETGQKIYFCGATWTTDRPSVVNAGMTDVAGFYEISGINYGAGQTFTAVASKNFYFNQSLEFNAANLSYADLTNFDLPDSSTLTLFVQAFDFNGNQTILSKANAAGSNLFMVCLNNGNLEMSVGGVSHSFGSLAMGFHHLAFTLLQNGTSLQVNFYKNGTAAGSHVFTGAAADLSGLPWKLGARATSPTAHSNYFTGLVDEAAFFDALLPLPDIQAFANVGTNVAHVNLARYFNLNEGSGTVLHDMGINLSGEGLTHETTWSTVAAVEEVLAHEMNPSSRLATLNPSNTSVDQVDFTDQSTVPVSGYVRFIGTTCFQDSVEILVNGEPHFPPVFTDEDGYFVADFEPGADVVLSPRFGDHVFLPAFWELDNLNTPVAGILFRNQTQRTIRGQLAGGECRRSILPSEPQQLTATVRVRTVDGCLLRDMVVANPNGTYVFTGLPPERYEVSLIYHSDVLIDTFFGLQGGVQVDLRMASDTVDFIYFAPHEVEIEAFPTNVCDSAMLVENSQYSVDIRVFQDYFGEKCYLDSALLRITNEISDAPQADSIMTGGREVFTFRPSTPNIVAPFKKLLEVVAIVGTDEAAVVQDAVVIGDRPRVNDFATVQPNIPQLILRDPPGDGSFAYREKNTTTCNSLSLEVTDALGDGGQFKLSLGPKFSISGGIGVEMEQEFETIIQTTGDFLLTRTTIDDTTLQVCLTNLESISTSSDQNIVGEQGGDVFMGSAVNIVFNEADLLSFNDTTCTFELSLSATAAIDSFGTTYVFSEYFIRDYVIPELEMLNTDSSLAAATQWRRILAYNDTLKQAAIFSRNISFDAGVTYEFSESFDTTRTFTSVVEDSDDFGLQTNFGAFVAGLGISGGYQLRSRVSFDTTTTNVEQNVTTVGFTLADDDPGDNFTVDILRDETYHTPVFLLKSGQTSCPHEPNTQNREGVQITGDNFTAVDVPYNAAAVFNLHLGNVSGSGETWSYYLALRPESNPNGAIVKANGAPLTLPVLYQVPFGQQLDVTVTVERGPAEFNYEDLQIAWYSGCEFDRITTLALNPFDFPLHYQTVALDVYFVEPCSPVDIGLPQQGWVLTPSGGNTMNVVLNSYEEDDPDLDFIRVQYRRSQGDGSWINIAEVPKAQLGATFTSVPWNTEGLSDGLYEIRAVTQCFGLDMEAGISHVIHGKIEREPPEIFGTPEPADGVLSAGDEISITFTEPIRCDLLIQADFFQNNNVGLYNTRTGDLVDFDLSCSGDKIVLVPNVANQFIENEILRVEIDDVDDLAGNTFTHTDWEFFVDRNPLRWQIPDLVDFKYEDEFKTIYRAIVNTGGSAQEYNLTGIPDWVNVFPTTGVLPPGQQQFITFEFDSSLVNGQFSDTILMDAPLGDEPLPVHFRNLCRPPAWEINPGDWDYGMNLTVELDIEGELSADIHDIVAAFVDGELRGMAYVERVVAGSQLDTFEVFLTVYSDTFLGEEITFQIWDASECLLYGDVLETFPFVSNEIIGAPNAPVTLHTNNLLLREIPLRTGWNWISFNLGFPNPNIDTVLASLAHPANDLIKSQTAFAEYANTTVGWVGSLATLGNLGMYQFRADVPDTISLLGNPIDVSATSIPLVAGWNWIGYLPQNPLPVDEALASLTPLNGDVVKNQIAFAQYVAGFGWLGNLQFMQAPEGYLLKVATAGTLSYPDNFTGGGGSENWSGRPVSNSSADKSGSGGRPVSTQSADRSGLNFSPWSVDPAQFEHTMILVGMLSENGENATREGLTLGAFANGEVRGVAPAMFVEGLDEWLFFLTTYANQSGEPLSFKLHDAESEAVADLEQGLFFAIDDQEGTVLEPMPFTLPANAAGEMFAAQTRLLIQPNPFRNSTLVSYEAAAAGEVALTVTDALGRLVERLKWQTAAGRNTLEWKAEGLPGGVYFLKVGAVCRKVVLER